MDASYSSVHSFCPDPTRHPKADLDKFKLVNYKETGRILGTGAYATVEEIEYKGLRCAAKKLHSMFTSKRGYSTFTSRFLEECNLLNGLRHPNIVQFLGIFYDSKTGVPVLVMEYLPGNLAQCLDRYGVLEDELTYPILRDVSLALRYLHERKHPIIHRDLSANNILLTTDMTAKISDLGLAKILQIHPNQKPLAPMTSGPGTRCYMPPEALVQNPQYDAQVDIFSFGVLIIHILTGQWPVPTAQFQAEPAPGNLPTGMEDYCIALPETARRQQYLSKISRNHPLMKVINRCLNDWGKRPTARELYQSVAANAEKFRPPFDNTYEMIKQVTADTKQKSYLKAENEALKAHQQDHQRKQDVKSMEIQRLQLQIANLKAENESMKQTMTWQSQTFDKMEKTVMDRQAELMSQHLRMYQAKIEAQQVEHLQQLELKSVAVASLQWELEAKGRLVLQKQMVIDSLSTQLSQALTQLRYAAQYNLLDPRCKVAWKEMLSVPLCLFSNATAVLIGDILYMGGGELDDDKKVGEYLILIYKAADDRWSALTPAPVCRFGLAALQGRPVLIGGIYKSSMEATADVHVYNQETNTWENESVPHMLMARVSPATVNYHSNIITCGGPDPMNCNKSSVEVYRSDIAQWYFAKHLPFLRAGMSAVMIGGLLFLLGGHDPSKPSPVDLGERSVVWASASDLIKSTIPTAAKENSPVRSLWQLLPDAPMYKSTVATMGGCLLCVGGLKQKRDRRSHDGIAVNHVYAFCQSSNSWVQVSSLPAPRACCTTFTLPTNELVVIGGSAHNTQFDSDFVFKATIAIAE